MLPTKCSDHCGILDQELIVKITRKLNYHIKQGHLAGPFSDKTLPYKKTDLHYSPVFGFLKASGKPVFIVDLSSPKDNSVNSFILAEDRHTSYPQFIDLCSLAWRIGKGGWFWTADALDAYWKIPICKKYWKLFAIRWRNKTLIYKCLSFGLASAPSIYNRFIKLFIWLCKHNHASWFNLPSGDLILNYLDDFFGGHPKKCIADKQKNYLLKKFDILNLPTSPSKCKGPSQTIHILGWIISSVTVLTINLTLKKRKKYSAAVVTLLANKKAALFNLEKLIGYLRYTTNIVPIGKLFIHPLELLAAKIRRDIEAKKSTKYKKYRFSKELIFCLLTWKGIYKQLDNNPVPIVNLIHPEKRKIIKIWSDASANLEKGIGGFDTLGNWYQFNWKYINIPKNHKYYKYIIQVFRCPAAIQYMEFLSIIVHIIYFVRFFPKTHVIIKNDNPVACKIAATGTIKKDSKLYYPLLNLLKVFALLVTKYQITYKIIKIDGKDNKIADALSRFEEPLPFTLPQPDLNKKKFKPRKNVNITATVNKLIMNTCIPYFMKVDLVKP